MIIYSCPCLQKILKANGLLLQVVASTHCCVLKI